MPVETIILLGAFAGSTIYLGLPLAFLKNMPRALKTFLSMFAAGILLFLFYDVIQQANEPVTQALEQVRIHNTGGGEFFVDTLLLVLGFGAGLVGLVYFNRYITLRFTSKHLPASKAPAVSAPELVLTHANAKAFSVPGTPPTNAKSAPHNIHPGATTPDEISSQALAIIIATGIGLHNFSEGLAIGQSAAGGALQLATVLIIGFALHNMTEGFGIAGPLTGQRISWRFIFLVGLIGGGPTFLGTIIGTIFHSPQIFIFCLALAAGAIVYVLVELFGIAKRSKLPEIIMWGLLAGFLLGYATDLIVTFGGA